MLNSRLILLSLIFSSAALAQIGYVAQKSTSLTSAAEVITVQQPSSGSKLVEFKSAQVDCSVACSVTVERDGVGNPATSTTLVPRNINPNETTAKATAWSSSNVGVGSVLNIATLAAGSFVVFDLNGIYLPVSNNPGNNFTIRTSAITGSVNITIKWTEK